MSNEEVDDNGPTGTYEGETLNGLRHGQGTYIFESGARYIGSWDRGLKHGTGTFMYPDGSRYEGQWFQNHKHGHGRYFYPNGDTYDGMWCLDKRQGHGLYWDAEKNVHYKGHFSNGNLNGPASVLMANGQFAGSFKDGKPVGKGTYTLPNGLSVEGWFEFKGEETPLWITTKVDRSYIA